MSNKKTDKNAHVFESMKYAIEGIWTLFKTEESIRAITVTCLIYIIIGFWLEFNYVEIIFGSFMWLMVLILEILNTAFEHDMDYTGNNEYHPRIKKVKDFAAATVFLASLFASICSLFFIVINILV